MRKYKSNTTIYGGSTRRYSPAFYNVKQEPNTVPDPNRPPNCPPCPDCPPCPKCPDPNTNTNTGIPPPSNNIFSTPSIILGVSGLLTAATAIGVAYKNQKPGDGMDERYDVRKENLQFL